MGNNFRKSHDERGVVALMTVMFFMIFISLIVMGFITLVVDDQRQTTDNDLSASALAAARGGVEEGKRILLYCSKLKQTDPVAYSTSECDEALNSQDKCDVFMTDAAALVTTLSLPINPITGEGVTGGLTATDYQQYFTCMTIQTQTPNVSMVLTKDSDYIQALKTVSPFTKLKVSWSGDGMYNIRTGTLPEWPRLSAWDADTYMPVIQLQFIPYTATTAGFSDLNAIEQGSKTVYIVPCDSAGFCTPTEKNVFSLDVRDPVIGKARSTPVPITYANCTTSGISSYSCSVMLSGFNGGNPGAIQYYTRAKILYGEQANLELAPQDATGPVSFDNIQPWIDVTGRTNDVFRRIRSRVSYAAPNLPLPQNALDTAAPVCKDMTVTSSAASSTYNCN